MGAEIRPLNVNKTMKLTDFQAIDLHCHYNSGGPHDVKFNPLHKSDLDYLLAEHRAANIQKTAMSTYEAVLSPENIILENEKLSTITDERDEIYQWIVVDPRNDESLHQASKLLKKPKTLGLKIHCTHGYDILEYGDKLFSFAEKEKTTVLMHPTKISEMPALADKYPGMRLIIAHLASLDHVEAVLAAKHGNIYLDTSGGDSNRNSIIEYAVSRIGSEKIYFGTDTYASGFQYGRIFFSAISDEDKKNILYKNALRDFDAFR